MRIRLSPFVIALIYGLVGACWILFSDRALASFVDDAQMISELQTYKGWFFVLTTAGMLWWLVRASTHRLAASEATLRDTVMHFPLPAVTLADDDRIELVNESFRATYGYTLKEIPDLAAWWQRAYPDEHQRAEARRRWYDDVAQARAGNGIIGPTLLTVIDLSGEAHRVEFTALALPHRIVVALRDTTRQHALEQRLTQAQKLEAIGRLAGGIAHDFNNILQGILGYAQMLGSEPLRSSAAKELAGKIEAAAERAADLTGKLLSFARRSQGERQTVDVNEAIEAASGIARHTLGPHITFEQSFGADVAVIADASLLQSAILNLIINARDAIDGSGSIRVAVEARSVVQDQTLPDGRYAVITISDTGCGMDAETCRQAVEPFFTSKPVGRGTGLGLPSAHGFATEYGGDLRLQSEPGVGTSVTLLLPAAGTSSDTPRGEPVSPVKGRSLTLLLVDDEAAIRDSVATILEASGHRVFTGVDGPSGLERFAALHHDLDAVILDLAMPAMDGRNCLQRMRAINLQIPVIIATGYADPATCEALRAGGAGAILRKPYALSELLDALEGVTAGPSTEVP